MRIVVIDDETDVATTLGEVVADLGHRALLAHSAEAALTTLERDAPDAILLDVRLPGMNGLEFLRRHRPRETTAPVIGISGVATDAEVWECLRLGALDFVRKPFSAELLAALMLYAEVRRGRDSGARPRVEHRRSLRVRFTSQVTVVEHSGTMWQTGAVDLSVFGMKVRPQPPSWPAEHARLSFTPPDGGPPLDLLAVLVRADSRGWAYRVNLTIGQFGQLRSLVGDLAAGSAASSPPKPVLAEYQAGTVQIIRGSGTGVGGLHADVRLAPDRPSIAPVRDPKRSARSAHGAPGGPADAYYRAAQSQQRRPRLALRQRDRGRAAPGRLDVFVIARREVLDASEEAWGRPTIV